MSIEVTEADLVQELSQQLVSLKLSYEGKEGLKDRRQQLESNGEGKGKKTFALLVVCCACVLASRMECVHSA